MFAGLWKGLRVVFTEPTIKGCCVHWTQAVWRKVQELGLRQAYLTDDGTFKYIKKVLSLLFLPAEHVAAAFDALMRQARTFQLVDLVDYVQRTWMTSSCGTLSHGRYIKEVYERTTTWMGGTTGLTSVPAEQLRHFTGWCRSSSSRHK
ncbi:hypothetical protein NP493_1966g00012 [Ridgeia piscesae]|uniref:MULE transposase domain-containing protein n=1 Tax=Ridgeia piscesae TaxID=27915 RepID=A0AAD9JPY9_RIDPI|nr:hypothetical protein NP493_1966g00012 [Ridgeia piscesae]